MAGPPRIHSPGRADARTALAVGVFALWLTFVVLEWGRLVALPLSHGVVYALIVGAPPLAVVAAVLSRSPTPRLPLLAGLACAVSAALLLVPLISRSPAIALAIPAVVIAALATHRFPTASLAATFLLASAYGSIDAFTGVPPGQVLDVILGGLWVGVFGQMILGRRRVRVRPTPAAVLLGAFVLMTLAAVLSADSVELGLRAFRFCGWHLSAVFLIAYGSFSERTLEGLRRAMAVVILLVAGYAAFRWALGHPSARESNLLGNAQQLQYDKVGTASERKLLGSFPDGTELGLWTACTIPFLIAMAVGARGKLRAVCLAALPLALVALFGSNQRNAAAAAAAGVATIVVVHLLSRGFRGPRLGVALAAVAVLMVSAVAIYPHVIDNPDKRQRYSNLLDPGHDPSFQERLQKWRQVIADLDGKPFGYGLGTGDSAAIPQTVVRLGADEIDSSYFKIAYEQGLLVLAFFVFALVVLLVELLRHALWTRAPGPAALTAAAAGTLVSMMVVFVGAIHIDRLAITTGWMIIGLGMAQYVSDGGGRQPQP